jgi:hypothetical protein
MAKYWRILLLFILLDQGCSNETSTNQIEVDVLKPVSLEEQIQADLKLPRIQFHDLITEITKDSYTMELFSLNPADQHRLPENDFHGWESWGSAKLSEIDAKELLQGLLEGIDSGGLQAVCFSPRHGLRITTSTKSLDILICYECLSIVVYERDKYTMSISTSSEPLKLFNQKVEQYHLKGLNKQSKTLHSSQIATIKAECELGLVLKRLFQSSLFQRPQKREQI